MKVESNNLSRQYLTYEKEYLEAVEQTLKSGWYILGRECEKFEENFAKSINAKFCIGLNSGLDALTLAFRALGIKEGDEVIVPANTFIASVLAITENGATPIFVEPDEFFNINVSKIEESITKNTKAILAVHLYGQTADMTTICDIAKKNNLYVVEDCAQAHYGSWDKKYSGTFGNIGCFSFFPTKNLGAFGDGGACVTNSEELAKKLRMLRNYGSEKKYYNEIEGVNSRLDELQAALLNVKLRHIETITNERKTIARYYLNNIKNKLIILPRTRKGSEHVYHLFVIYTSEREKMQEYLNSQGIKTQIHYPIPPHLAQCYQYLGYKEGNFPIAEDYAKHILSLPLYNGMTQEEMKYVVDVINNYR